MKPFLQGRPVHGNSPLRPLDTGAGQAIASAKAAAGASCGVKVDTIKEGEKVVKIVVTCSCGERIEIDCLYAGGA